MVGPSTRRGPAAQHASAMLKAVDLAGPITVGISTTPTFTLLNATQTGAGFFNRIGSRITLKSLHLVGQLLAGGVGAGVAEYLRILIIYDKQANGAVPNIADILLDQNQTAATTTTNSWSHLNIVNRDRFMVLMDNRVDVPINSAAATTENIAAVIDYNGEHNVNRFVRLNDLETMYKSSSAPTTIADISVGSLWLVTFGNIGVATAAYAFSFNSRLRYYDC